MRCECLFNYCSCTKYKKNNGICLNCNHGKVWHKKYKTKKEQFLSSRVSARNPQYIFMFVQEPLIEVVAEPIYCANIVELPV